MASQDAPDWETEKDRRRDQKHTSSRERQLKAHEEKEKAEKEAENWVREKEAEWERRRLAAMAKQSPPSSQVSPSPNPVEDARSSGKPFSSETTGDDVPAQGKERDAAVEQEVMCTMMKFDLGLNHNLTGRRRRRKREAKISRSGASLQSPSRIRGRFRRRVGPKSSSMSQESNEYGAKMKRNRLLQRNQTDAM